MCTQLKDKLVSTDELSETYPSGCGLLLRTGALIPEESHEIGELTAFFFAVGRRFVTRMRSEILKRASLRRGENVNRRPAKEKRPGNVFANFPRRRRKFSATMSEQANERERERADKLRRCTAD